jgi:hypothetical protein
MRRQNKMSLLLENSRKAMKEQEFAYLQLDKEFV